MSANNNHEVPLHQRTADACAQFDRYGGSVWSHELADVLDELVEVNDDLQHDRDITLIRDGIEKTKALLDILMAVTQQRHDDWRARMDRMVPVEFDVEGGDPGEKHILRLDPDEDPSTYHVKRNRVPDDAHPLERMFFDGYLISRRPASPSKSSASEGGCIVIDKQTFGPGELYRILPDGTKAFVGSVMELMFTSEPAEPKASHVVSRKPPRTRKTPPAPRGPSVRSIRSGGAS